MPCAPVFRPAYPLLLSHAEAASRPRGHPMAQETPRVQLEGSTRSAPPHERVGTPDMGSTATVTVYLRGPAETPPPGSLSREEYAAAHGAAEADVEAVRSFAEAHQFEVAQVDRGRRSVQLTGTIGALADAFGTEVALFRDPDGTDLPRPGGHPLRARRARRRGHGSVRTRRAESGTCPLPAEGERSDPVHTARGGRRLRLPDRPDRERRMHRPHRARGRVPRR